MSKKNKSGGGFVFSTNPDFKWDNNSDERTSGGVPADKQPLRIWLQRIKGNKEATVIKGFTGSDDAISDLAKTLKSKCATGGNAKDGEIILQGDHRDKVLNYLISQGYTNTKKAGG